MKKVIVPLAHGVEELEIVSVIDVLRRAGVGVVVAAVSDIHIIAANLTKLSADESLAKLNLKDFDAIVVPGGTQGAEHCSASELLVGALKDFAAQGKLVAAICASPAVVLAKHGLLNNVKATCYPSLREQIPHYVDQAVVRDGHFITSQGPATALAFALAVAETQAGPDVVARVKEGMLVRN
jgi:4-methyl-5(b-hydroxyethyl)-thiazole monophosphate biosynthesis